MSKYQLARRAVRNFPRNSLAERRTTNYLRRQWIKAVEQLGGNWIALRTWTKDDQRRLEGVMA